MGLSLLIFEVSRAQTYDTRYDFSGRVNSPSRSEPAIPARERPQTHAFDRMASRIVKKNIVYIRCILLNMIPFKIIPICINKSIPPIALLILNLGKRRSSVVRIMLRPLYETMISRYPLNKRRSTPRSKCGRFGEGKNLLFFPGIEPPFSDCSARSPAPKPPTVRILHTNRTNITHTCSPVHTAGLHRPAMYALFPAS
jgi:hypothetical protein